MLNLFFSLLAGAAAFFAAGYFGAHATESFRAVYGIVPGVLVMLIVYVLLGRRVLKKFEHLSKQVEAELVKASDPGRRGSKKQRDMAWERAVGILESGYSLRWWQFFMKSQIEGQIGILRYVNGDLENARPNLENAFIKNWLAQAMLGAIHFKAKDYDAMRLAFEKAVRAGKKESLAWGVYSWCAWRAGDRDEAIEILNRAKKKISDERLEANLKALQNNRKMKMEGWREMWYQFQLVRPPVQRTSGHPHGGRISKKQLYG